MITVRLAGPVDEAGFRRACRSLLTRGVVPEDVQWHTGEGPDDLFSADGVDDELRPDLDAGEPAAAPLTVPRACAELLPDALLHADPRRHALLYRLLWRLQREPALRGDPLDPLWVELRQLAQQVRRDAHKMTAFVRFRPIDDGQGAPLHVAWYVPAHHVVERMAPFFARRFAALRWSILTPLRSVRWDGQALHFGPGASAHDAPPPDAGEGLWLTYYRHIFNPARLKLATMAREMPRRYWAALPEAALIAPLAASAAAREAAMRERPPTGPSPRRRLGRPADGLPGGVQATHHPMSTSPDFDSESAREAPDADLARLAGAAPAERRRALAGTHEAAAGCTRCPLYAGATQVVFGEGPVGAARMFVGEQPGDQEDLRGQPFVGPAGQLFDRAIAELGQDRRQLYVSNAVKHFKYELRGRRRIHKTPAQQEVAACVDWLEREIALVQPQRLVALGATAARALLGRPVAVLKERGRWLRRDDGLQVLVTLHPSALLRMPPEQHEAAWADWLADLRRAFDDDDAGG